MSESNRTNRRMTVIITWVAGGIFLIGAGITPLLVNAQQKALAVAAPILSPVIINQPAPQLTLTDLQENPVSIEDYAGLVVLINNWATWCPPCKIEMPELQAYYKAHAEEGFVVVSIESGEPADQVAAFVRDYGMTFPVWLDPQGKALDIFENWNLPSSYVIDKDGTMRFSWTGGINQSTLEFYITPLLENSK
jgi:peroxiredoxin